MISGSCTIFCTVPGINSRDDGLASKTAFSIEQIDCNRADGNIYTDGSATAGTTDGGFATIIAVDQPIFFFIFLGNLRPIAVHYRSYEECVEFKPKTTARQIRHKMAQIVDRGWDLHSAGGKPTTVPTMPPSFKFKHSCFEEEYDSGI